MKVNFLCFHTASHSPPHLLVNYKSCVLEKNIHTISVNSKTHFPTSNKMYLRYLVLHASDDFSGQLINSKVVRTFSRDLYFFLILLTSLSISPKKFIVNSCCFWSGPPTPLKKSLLGSTLMTGSLQSSTQIVKKMRFGLCAHMTIGGTGLKIRK